MTVDNYQDSRCLDLEKALADESVVAPINLPCWFLKAITQDFSDNQCIGSGGFGSVYKGTLSNGMVVAVKRLHNKIEVQEEDFQREVACLEEVKHKNVVRFLGYCYQTEHIRKLYKGRYVWADDLHMLFCFEFLSKGSLADHVSDASSGLEWKVRYQIIKGICEGVAHLHERCIIHRDLKLENILLDDTMVPKIADFGISRRFKENQTKIITGNIVGSRGYMAPEFLTNGTISFRTDIYSLGVIIIQLLTGSKKRPNNVYEVLQSWMNTFGTSILPLEQVQLCAQIGIDCMHDDPSRRPDIQDIIRWLNEARISAQGQAVKKEKKCPFAVVKIEISDENDAGCVAIKKAFAKGNGKGKRKELSPQDAALLIQMTYRAHLAHRSQVLRCLRYLAVAKARLKELGSLFYNISYRRRIAHDHEERQRFSEKIIVLFLTVDALEGPDYMVRNAKKSMLEELEAMLEVVDPPPGKQRSLSRRKFDLPEGGAVSDEKMAAANKAVRIIEEGK